MYTSGFPMLHRPSPVHMGMRCECWRLCSALKEVSIPPGPRLLILHHLERYRHVLKPGMPMPTPQQMPSQQGQLQPVAQPRQ